MLPSDMNLRIGNVKNYNNKILISSPSFKIGTNLKINLDDKPDIKSNKEHKQDVKPDIKLNDVNIPEDIRRFQKTLQYARSKVDYAIGEFIYMLPSDMNLRIGNVKNYNNKILISSPSFKIGTNLKINLDDKPDIKSNKEHKQDVKPDIKLNDVKPVIKPNKEHKQDVKPDIKPNKEHKQDVKPNRPDIKQNIEISRSKPDTNEITYEDEKVALVLGTTAVFTVWWMFK